MVRFTLKWEAANEIISCSLNHTCPADAQVGWSYLHTSAPFATAGGPKNVTNTYNHYQFTLGGL